METKGFYARIETKKLYDQEQRWMNRAQEHVDNLLTNINGFLDKNRFLPDKFPEITEEHPNKKTIIEQQELLEKINHAFDSMSDDLKAKINDTWNKGEKSRWKQQLKEKCILTVHLKIAALV